MIHVDQHYVDPRLVELYESENSSRTDTEFYLHLTAELHANRILDLGCGTGMLTRELALTEDRQVIGVDPAPAMLAFARRQAGADRVQWRAGDAHALGTPAADLVLMTGNVAQVFLDDTDWADTLHAIHAALRPGGYLAFESRNPDAQAWEGWNRAATYEQIDSPSGPIETWLELISVDAGRVRFAGHNIFQATGELLVVESELRFRSLAELNNSLREAGFTIEHLYGDWDRGPVHQRSKVMIFVARRS